MIKSIISNHVTKPTLSRIDENKALDGLKIAEDRKTMRNRLLRQMNMTLRHAPVNTGLSKAGLKMLRGINKR